MKIKLLPAVAFAGLMTLGLSLTGCGSSTEEDISYWDAAVPWTPRLDSTARTHEQDYTRYARSIDHTTRQAWDDLAMLLLIDDPIKLTEYPIP